MTKERKSAESLNKKREAALSKTQKLKDELSDLNFNQDTFSSLEQEKDQLTTSVEELHEIVETLTAQLGSRLSFNYSDPVRGFDRSKVKGLVAKLIEVHNPEHSTALEVVSGGKLYQVVVDEAITGKAILDRGKLQRRVTIIPLDKIQPRRVTNAASSKATEIAKNHNANAWPAIELVGFDEEVRAAMEYVFGASIVVDDAKAANQICDATKTRTVTLQGDVYDPSGTISGGSASSLGSTLTELSKLADANKSLTTNRARLAVVLNELDQLQSNATQFDKLSRKLSLAEAELDGLQKHLSQTSYGILEEKFNAMSKEIEEANDEYQSMQTEQKKKWDLYHELKEREVELTQQREDRLGRIEQSIKDAKRLALDKGKKAREAESRKQTLSLELESLHVDVLSAEENVVAAEEAKKEAAEDESVKEIAVGDVKARWDDAKDALEKFEEKLSQFSSELSKIKDQKTSLSKKAENCTLEAKKLTVSINRIRKERHNAEKVVASLLKTHPWIESEKSAFGVAGGDYDFEATDPTEMSQELQSLKGEQEALVSSFLAYVVDVTFLLENVSHLFLVSSLIRFATFSRIFAS